MSTTSKAAALAIVQAIDAAILEMAGDGWIDKSIDGISGKRHTLESLTKARAVYAAIANAKSSLNKSAFGYRSKIRMGRM